MEQIKLYELRKVQSEFPAKRIASSNDAAEFVRQFYTDDIDIFESSFILLLNRSNTTIGYAKISQGGITGTVIDVRLILKYALESLATGIILCHNHPSGNLTPSGADLDLTKKLRNAASTMDISLTDHLILNNNNYYSLADNGEI